MGRIEVLWSGSTRHPDRGGGRPDTSIECIIEEMFKLGEGVVVETNQVGMIQSEKSSESVV
jgi:hypothetical protein